MKLGQSQNCPNRNTLVLLHQKILHAVVMRERNQTLIKLMCTQREVIGLMQAKCNLLVVLRIKQAMILKHQGEIHVVYQCVLTLKLQHHMAI